jgi:tetratricopeptide (TPR) repeat protein
MNASTDFCKIPGPYGYKWPNLEELYYKLFQGNFNAHNALDDLRACAKCFWKLNDLGILNLNLIKENKVTLLDRKLGEQRENVDPNKTTSASEVMGIYDVEVQLIINKIIDAKNKRLDWLNENNWSISKAGELELIIYYLFYVLKSLIYGGYTELKTKEIEKEEKGKIIWRDTYLWPKILVDDSIIKQLSIFFKKFIKIKCEEIGHTYNDFQITELINGRFTLYRFDDIFMMQSFDGGGSYVNNEIYKLILTNPIENKVIVKENHAYIIDKNGDEIKSPKFSTQWMLDSIDDLMYSLDFDAQKYFYNKISPEIRLDQIISIINPTLEEKIIEAHLVASTISDKDYRDKSYADIVHILINKGEKSEALKTVKLISKENSFASLKAYGSICSYLIKNNEIEEALRIADLALNKTISDRYHNHLYYSIVLSMAQIGETSQALLFYEKIKVSDIDTRFHKHWAINSICRELISSGKKEQAIELAKKFKPYLGFLYPIVEISKILLKNNETDKVKSIITQIESNGIKEAIYNELIIYYLQNRNKEEAYQIIHDNYINDNKASVLSDIVPHIIDNFTLDEAIIIAESIIDEHKIYCSAAYLSICKHIANMGKFPEALKIIDKIVNIEYVKKAHSEIAIILMRKGFENDALNSIELMNQKYDDASNEIDDTYFEFSKLLITNGSNEKALEYVKKIKSKPIRKKAYKFIVNYLLEEENWKEAFELAESCDCYSYASWKRSRLFLVPGDVLSIFLDT